MKVAFAQFFFFEYIGVMYLSACLKRSGHDVEVFIPTSTTEKFVKEIVDFKPDVIGFSIMTGSQNWALQLSNKIKKKIEVYSIFGGAHPTFFPEILNEDGVDCVCIGEADETLVEIANMLSNGIVPKNIPGAWFKVDGKVFKNEPRSLLENLEELPYPDRALYRNKYPAFPKSKAAFFAGRGCPFKCTFCFNHSLIKMYRNKGRYVRFRPVDDLINEIKDVIKDGKVKTIYFQDDTFILKKNWLKEFSKKYKQEINLPFICLIRADLTDEETVRSLAEANCKSVFFGIESGDEYIRNAILKKNLTDQQIINCARLLKKYKIIFRSYNMVGLPGETLEDAFKTVRLNTMIKTDYPWCSIFQPFPKTELAEYTKKVCKVDEERMLTSSSFFKDSSLEINNKNELVNLQKLFFYAVKFPSFHFLIRKAIKLKPNVFFEILFLMGYGWCYLFSELVSLRDLFFIGRMNVKKLLFRKQEIRQ